MDSELRQMEESVVVRERGASGEGPVVSAVWERGLALVIDLAVTALFTAALIGLVGGFPLKPISAHPHLASLLWAFLFSLYHGLMGSRLFRGRTLGKTATHLCLIREDGKFLSVRTSLNRSAVLAASVIAPSAALAYGLGPWGQPLGALIPALVCLFRGKRHQGLHDSLSKTYVVEAPHGLRMPGIGYAASALIFLVVAAGSYRVGKEFSQRPAEGEEIAPEEVAQWTPEELEEKAKALVPAAELELGLRMMKGDRVALDYDRGVELVQFAAQQGYPTAQLVLGYLHLARAKEDPRHTEQGIEWFRKAAQQHEPHAVELLKTLKTQFPDRFPGATVAESSLVEGTFARWVEKARALYHRWKRPAGETAGNSASSPDSSELESQ